MSSVPTASELGKQAGFEAHPGLGWIIISRFSDVIM
jgi:hypothetical protein